jgi:hypothetical protein
MSLFERQAGQRAVAFYELVEPRSADRPAVRAPGNGAHGEPAGNRSVAPCGPKRPPGRDGAKNLIFQGRLKISRGRLLQIRRGSPLATTRARLPSTPQP